MANATTLSSRTQLRSQLSVHLPVVLASQGATQLLSTEYATGSSWKLSQEYMGDSLRKKVVGGMSGLLGPQVFLTPAHCPCSGGLPHAAHLVFQLLSPQREIFFGPPTHPYQRVMALGDSERKVHDP